MLACRRSLKYLRSTRSMNAERDCFDPARRSTLARSSFDSVIDVFSFILPSYYSPLSAGERLILVHPELRGEPMLPASPALLTAFGHSFSLRRSRLTTCPFDLRLLFSPPRGRLDGNCPLEQVAGAIPGGYAATYSPIHEVPFGRRDAQPQDFACPNISPAAGFGQFRVIPSDFPAIPSSAFRAAGRVTHRGFACTAGAGSSCVASDVKRATIAARPNRSASAPGPWGPAPAAGSQRPTLVPGANDAAAVNP